MPHRRNEAAQGDSGAEQAAVRGRPVGDHAVKRKELLRAAASVIARDGYAKASLRKVAEHAGYSTGAVTYYFANKEELILALVEDGFDRFDAMLESVRESGEITTLFESWLALTTGNHKFWPVMAEMLAHGRHEPAFAQALSRRYARFRRVQAAILKDGQERGTVRDDLPAEMLAEQLSAMGDGWMLMYPIEPKRFTPRRLRALIDGVAALIAPRPQAGRP